MKTAGAALILLGVGCGPRAAFHAADAGDRAALRAALDEVEPGDAKAVAERVLRYEVLHTAVPVLLEELDRRCVPEVGSALAERARGDDRVAAHAALLRLDAELDGPRDGIERLRDADDGWRAVAARSLSTRFDPGYRNRGAVNLEREAVWRRRLIQDPSALVRRGALRAAVEAMHPGDGPAVLEAIRLEPEADLRLLAIEAAGAIATRDAVLGLVDRWEGASEEERRAIVAQWAQVARSPSGEAPQRCSAPPQHPACLSLHYLERTATTDDTIVGTEAALALLRNADPAEPSPVQRRAEAVIERHIDKGAPRGRVVAIQGAPLGFAHLAEAVADAVNADDARVVAAAHARLLSRGTAAEKKVALEKLRALAKGGDGYLMLAAPIAKDALAQARDEGALTLFKADLKAPSRAERLAASRRLSEAGHAEGALILLADDDPQVRTGAACAILVAER